MLISGWTIQCVARVYCNFTLYRVSYHCQLFTTLSLHSCVVFDDGRVGYNYVHTLHDCLCYLHVCAIYMTVPFTWLCHLHDCTIYMTVPFIFYNKLDCDCAAIQIINVLICIGRWTASLLNISSGHTPFINNGYKTGQSTTNVVSDFDWCPPPEVVKISASKTVLSINPSNNLWAAFSGCWCLSIRFVRILQKRCV